MSAIWDKPVTLLRLGLLNVFRVGGYRLLGRLGYYRRSIPGGKSYSGPFWTPESWAMKLTPRTERKNGRDWYRDALRILSGELPFFSAKWQGVGFPPKIDHNLAGIHWADIDEFSLATGDIKNLWEPSRFDGLLILAVAWLRSGDSRLPQAIEHWMEDWVQENPANLGPQWKCGQETAIRLMQVLLVAELLRRHAGIVAMPALDRFVVEHCRRIEPTLLYAVAQDNNHGTSEAAALFMAGNWLLHRPNASSHRKDANRWRQKGRKWLENRIQRLILTDGSFSQHSVNYHRLMLDTVAVAEWWRQQFGDQSFSELYLDRCRAATSWLAAMVDPWSGDAPNLGANDGARIFVLHGLPYRDFRPTVQLASILFDNRATYPEGPWDETLIWLGIKRPLSAIDSSFGAISQVFLDGGYVKLAAKKTWIILRLPRYCFRPSHSDALHIDLWHEGINIVRDGGSFSYNSNEQEMSYFPGTVSHSTVQLDGRDQMPRLGRFLFGSWLECRELAHDTKSNKIMAGYRDYAGGEHRRSVTLREACCEIEDNVSGFSKRAVLRWRLAPDLWRIDGMMVTGRLGTLTVKSDVPVRRAELITGWESRHYGEKTALPVFEVEIDRPGSLHTLIVLGNQD